MHERAAARKSIDERTRHETDVCDAEVTRTERSLPDARQDEAVVPLPRPVDRRHVYQAADPGQRRQVAELVPETLVLWSPNLDQKADRVAI